MGPYYRPSTIVHGPYHHSSTIVWGTGIEGLVINHYKENDSFLNVVILDSVSKLQSVQFSRITKHTILAPYSMRIP